MKKSLFTASGKYTGAKKAASALSLALIMGITPITVKADVPPSLIIGDLQTTEDRTEIKLSETYEIMQKFCGLNADGKESITMEEIEKAICLSDVLNSYYFDLLNFTNARSSEVIDLDINRIYNYYVEATLAGTEQDMEYFYKNTLPSKPAIDGFITFASGTILKNIEKSIGNMLVEYLLSEGYQVNEQPKIITSEKGLFAIVRVNGRLVKYNISEISSIPELSEAIAYLNKTYQTAIANISGTSEYHDNSFMYNGIDTVTNESAWLSLPDDEKKDAITEAINIYRNLQSGENYVMYSTNDNTYALSEEEVRVLDDLGYSQEDIASALRKDIVIHKLFYDKVLSK